MANMSADYPGTQTTCPDCSETVDPYYHCCPYAKNDKPYEHQHALTQVIEPEAPPGSGQAPPPQRQMPTQPRSTFFPLLCTHCGNTEEMVIIQLGNGPR